MLYIVILESLEINVALSLLEEHFIASHSQAHSLQSLPFASEAIGLTVSAPNPGKAGPVADFRRLWSDLRGLVARMPERGHTVKERKAEVTL